MGHAVSLHDLFTSMRLNVSVMFVKCNLPWRATTNSGPPDMKCFIELVILWRAGKHKPHSAHCALETGSREKEPEALEMWPNPKP